MTLARPSLPFRFNPTTDSLPADPDIVRGDEAARSGRWLEAIQNWLMAKEVDLAQERIRWFLESQSAVTPQHELTHRRRARAMWWIAACVLAGGLGTGLVLLNLDRSGSLAIFLSVSAWVCFGLAMVTAITYAWKLGQATTPTALSEDDIARAITIAASLNTTQDTSDAEQRREEDNG